MKRTYIAIISVCVLALPGGCVEEKSRPSPEDRPHVVINGSLEKTKTDSRAQIVPNNGLPTKQLAVGIATVSYTTADPAVDQPDLGAWSGSTTELMRGFFGGPGINPPTVLDGQIAYTNEDGSAIQKIFYDDAGEYYFLRVCHPFLNDSGERIQTLRQTTGGAEVVVSQLDGSQDIMCSNLAWGNVDNVEVKTAAMPNGEVVLSHMFSLFRIRVKAENAKAATQFGEIEDFVLRFQPASVGINMTNLDITPSNEQVDYQTVGFTPFALYTEQNGVRVAIPGAHDVRNPDGSLSTPAASPVEAGYVMALPATTFRFEALTTDRLWIHANVSFATAEDQFATSVPGTAYDVIITLMESYEIQWEVQPVKNWWYDSVFD